MESYKHTLESIGLFNKKMVHQESIGLFNKNNPMESYKHTLETLKSASKADISLSKIYIERYIHYIYIYIYIIIIRGSIERYIH